MDCGFHQLLILSVGILIFDSVAKQKWLLALIAKFHSVFEKPVLQGATRESERRIKASLHLWIHVDHYAS